MGWGDVVVHSYVSTVDRSCNGFIKPSERETIRSSLACEGSS